jgi:hypothetical protein
VGQNVELLNVKAGGTYSDHWAVEGQIPVIKSDKLMLYGEKKSLYVLRSTQNTQMCGAEHRISEF